MGERVPQHVQNIVLRNYCQSQNHNLLLAATEYAMPDSSMILETVLQELRDIDGIVMYSLYQLPRDTSARADVIRRVLAAGRSLHFAVENMRIVDSATASAVERCWQVKTAIDSVAPTPASTSVKHGELRSFVSPLHRSTRRDYRARMLDDKSHCMQVAKRYGRDYWDGDRRYGYGGYVYRPGYWTPVAEALINTYGLRAGSRVLDIGCGKAFLLHELLTLEPDLEVVGGDISQHGLDGATEIVRPHLRQLDARRPLPFGDREFDLVISLATLHNLRLPDLQGCLSEIARVGHNGYIMVESYRNEHELFNLQCWALTCETFLDVEAWKWLFTKCDYRGDYEFIYFE
jgi:sporadic carbohydrate cluster protein (TIGR04323 family)